jgi:hypothetical protein
MKRHKRHPRCSVCKTRTHDGDRGYHELRFDHYADMIKMYGTLLDTLDNVTGVNEEVLEAARAGQMRKLEDATRIFNEEAMWLGIDQKKCDERLNRVC